MLWLRNSALLVLLALPAFAQANCGAQEIAAFERGDSAWLIQHLVAVHHVERQIAAEFVGDQMREFRNLSDIRAAARHQAEKDLAEGRCDYLEYGMPSDPDFDTKLRARGLQPVRVALCLVRDEDRAYCDAYDDVVTAAVGH